MAKFNDVKVWVFDLDSVLYPAELEKVLLGKVSSYFKDFFIEHYGWSDSQFEARKAEAIEANPIDPNALLKQQVDFEQAAWDAFIVQKIDYSVLRPCTETIELLQALPGKKVVFTNGGEAHARAALAQLDIENIFEVVSTNTGRDMRAKPDPTIYTELQAQLGEVGSAIAFADDKPENLPPAHALGWQTVQIGHTSPKKPELFDVTSIGSQFAALPDYLNTALQGQGN